MEGSLPESRLPGRGTSQVSTLGTTTTWQGGPRHMASLGLGDLVCRGARYRSHWPLLASEGQVSCHQLPCSWRLEKVRGTHLALGGEA